MKIETIFAAIMLTVIGLFVTLVLVGRAESNSHDRFGRDARDAGEESLFAATFTGYENSDFCLCFDQGYATGLKDEVFWQARARKITPDSHPDGRPMTRAEFERAVGIEATRMMAVAYDGGYATCLEQLGPDAGNAWATAYTSAKTGRGARRCPAYRQQIRSEERRLERAAALD